MIRLGLCCMFWEQPIKFRTITAANLTKFSDKGGKPHAFLSQLILDNLKALHQAITWCAEHGIGCFRIYSELFGLYTHPTFAYTLSDLEGEKAIRAALEECKNLAKDRGIRLVLHPDQFVVLNSLKEEVVTNSIQELEYQNTLADFVGVDVINIHAGGVFGDKKSALERLKQNLKRLSPGLLSKITLENDDVSYSPNDLLPFCLEVGVPFVYDVHHHRCLPDKMGIEEATMEAIETWNREPLLHISSPKDGWKSLNPKVHDDYVHIEDFPASWRSLGDVTIEVEAKAKEKAVLRLREELAKEGVNLWPPGSPRAS